LRKDIDCFRSDSYYDIKFNDFDGVFDGGGKSISGIMDGLSAQSFKAVLSRTWL
jgi:hypothetical protein